MLIASICMANEDDAACFKLYAKTFKPNEEDGRRFVKPHCKVNPDEIGQTFIVANYEKILINNKTGEILSQDEHELRYDGTFESIDTGRFWLTKKVRAFGIRYRIGTTRYGSQQVLDLYVVDGRSIKPVLQGLVLQDVAEACGDDGKCTYIFDNNRSIDIAKTNHNGYADIIVREKDLASQKIIEQLLIYDGTTYVIPDNYYQHVP